MVAFDIKNTANNAVKHLTNYRNKKNKTSSFRNGKDEGWMASNYMVILCGLVHDIGTSDNIGNGGLAAASAS